MCVKTASYLEDDRSVSTASRRLEVSSKLGMLALCLGLSVSSALAEPIHLKLAMFSPDTERSWSEVFKPWANAVNAAGTGVVQIDTYPNGALGKALPEQSQMVLDGVADIAFVIPGVTPGRFPDNEVMDLPGFFETSEEATRVYTQLIKENALNGFENFHVLGVMGTPPFWIYAKSKITSLAELKGKKIRGTNPLQSATLKALGAVPILMPVPEVAEAVGRGTIDGATEFPGALFDFGIDRVTSYDYALPVGISSLTLLMNKAKYDSLPPEAKSILDRFGLDWVGERFTKYYGAYQDGLYAKLAADKNRVLTRPSAEETAQGKAVFDNVIGDWVRKRPRNQDLVNALRAELTQIRSK
jgi:TRAP-type C4-dicarboxylate transport system substrate-binding protein